MVTNSWPSRSGCTTHDGHRPRKFQTSKVVSSQRGAPLVGSPLKTNKFLIEKQSNSNLQKMSLDQSERQPLLADNRRQQFQDDNENLANTANQNGTFL